MTDAVSLLAAELYAAAERVISSNRAVGRRIAVAESCTGGLVAAALTEVPGSSDVFDAGFVTYSNDAKTAMLGVSEEVIEAFGAVSVETGRAMARGALDRSRADIAVAITGVAGPGGGSAVKPVGTVVLTRAVRGGGPDDVEADARRFEDRGRAAIRLQAALAALELLMPESAGSPA